MIVSIINGQSLYGVEHPKAENTYTISQEEFSLIQSGKAIFSDGKVEVLPVIEEETPVQTVEDITEQKIKEAEVLVIRKLAMETIGEDTKEIEKQILSLNK